MIFVSFESFGKIHFVLRFFFLVIHLPIPTSIRLFNGFPASICIAVCVIFPQRYQRKTMKFPLNIVISLPFISLSVFALAVARRGKITPQNEGLWLKMTTICTYLLENIADTHTHTHDVHVLCLFFLIAARNGNNKNDGDRERMKKGKEVMARQCIVFLVCFKIVCVRNTWRKISSFNRMK